MPLDRDIAAGYTGRPTGRPTGRTLAGTIGRTVGGEPRLGETGRSLGPAGGPTTFRNTYPQTADIFDKHLQSGPQRYTTDFFERLQAKNPIIDGMMVHQKPQRSFWSSLFDYPSFMRDTDKSGNYINEGIGSLTPSNIGFDRMGGPDKALPGDTLHMLENPENYRGMEDLMKLENQMDTDNFLTNRLAIGEKWGVNPFGDQAAGEGFYTRDGEFVEAPLGGFEDRLDSLLGDIIDPTTYEGFSPYYPDNLDVRYPGDFEASGQAPYGDQSAVDPSDWRVIQQILGAGGNPDDYIQSAGIMGALPQEENLMQQAKVYTNQDPGMIDEGYFWDDISPEAKAINKAYDYLRSKKPIYGSDPQGLRNAIENQLFEDERMYRNMLPESIRRDLPEDAFENLDDFRNQQRIILT